MAGFKRFNGGYNGAPQEWSIVLKSSSYDENGNFIIRATGIKNTDIPKVANLDHSVYNIKYDDTSRIVLITVFKDKVNEFVQNAIPNIVSILSKAGGYKAESLANFKDNVEDQIELSPTPEEIEASNVTIAKNWKEVATQLQDPEVRKRLLAFQTTSIYKNEFGGEPLSPKNVTDILMQDPMASFVTSAKQWARWNRSIQSNAPFVVFEKVEWPSIGKKYLDQDPIAMKEGGWDNVIKKYGATSQVAFGIRKRTAKRLKLTFNSYKAKGYDVRYTIPPTDKTQDTFLTIAGLANNLTGELNQVAKQILRDQAIANGEEMPDFDKKIEGAERKDLIGLRNYFIKKCKKVGITIDDTQGTTEDIISDAIYQYAYSEAEKHNKLTPESKHLFASVVLSALAASLNIQSPKVSACANVLSKFKGDAFDQINQITWQTYLSLANAIANARSERINEGVGGMHIMNFDEFNKFIEQQMGGNTEGTMEENAEIDIIKENFYKFLDRMDNSGKDDCGNSL